MDTYKYTSTGFESSLKEVYSQNYSSCVKTIRMGTIVVSLMFLTPVNAETIVDDKSFEEIKTLTVENIPNTRYTGSDSVLNGLNLFVPRAAAYSREFVNNTHFYTSFEQNCGSKGRIALEPLFNMMANSLNSIKIVKSYVDVSEQRGLIEFNLNIGKGIVVTALKGLSSIDNDMVNFTVSVNGVLKVADIMPLSSLKEKLLQIQKTFSKA